VVWIVGILACVALFAIVRLLSSKTNALPEAPPQTAAEFDAPMWLFGSKSAESWLLPREPARKRVVVVDFSDPFEKSGTKERDWLVDNAAFLLAETLWMRTDAPATAAVIVSRPLKKIISPHDALAPWENLSGLTDSFKEPAVVAWGTANRDIDREGLTMKVRISDEKDERSFTAPYAELEKTLLDWLVGRELCARVAPPAWYAPPKPEQLSLWAIVHHNIQLQALADAKNGVLAPLDADFHDDMVDYALDAVAVLEGAGEQVKLAAIVCAMYAKRAGALKEERRTKILELVASLSHPDLVRLSRRYYHALGEPARADAIKDETDAYRTFQAEAYSAWLLKIRDA
jgi:hypothetical protein